MNNKQRLPASLVAVAVLFILGGSLAVVEIGVSLARGHTSINLNVLGLLIGPGLLALRPGYRAFALVFLWASIVALVIAASVMLAHSGPLDFELFGEKIGLVSRAVGLAVAVGIFLVLLWPIRLLNRSDVAKLFGVEPG